MKNRLLPQAARIKPSSTNSRFVMVCSVLLLAVITPSSVAQHSGDVVRVGVLSPERGSLMSMARARKHWIDMAFRGNETVLADSPISIELIYADTRSQETDEFCADNARELLEAGAVILIGPVRSGCVKSVLDARLEVPFVTTLASATDLTAQGNEWFFRANINDLRRLQTLWEEVQAQRRREPVAGATVLPIENVALHEASKYGRGLAEDLLEVVRPDDVIIQELDQEMSADEAAALLGALLDQQPERQIDLFLLGSAPEPAISAMLQAIREVFYDEPRIHAIYTVGSSIELLQFSPMGVITVGEPALGEVHSSPLEAEIAQRIQQAPENLDFYPTTYQLARFVVPRAIALAAKDVADLTDLGAMRNAIRHHLATYRFDSLQPPAQVHFSDGEMEPLFDLPVYEIAPEFRRLNAASAESGWIEYPDGALRMNFLETPMKVRVLGHQTEGSAVTLSLYRQRGEDGELENTGQSAELDLADGAASTVTFHIRQPGNYSVRSNLQSYPAQFTVDAQVSPFYFICVFAALLAVLLKHKFVQISWPMRLELFVESTVAGLAVAFISTYIQYSLLPVSPLDWNLINGLLYGFIGGWFGPALITHWSDRVIPSRQGAGE